MIPAALSQTPFVAHLIEGPRRPGTGLGHGHVRFGRYVVTITPPAAPRMPNGIECDLTVREGETAWIGEGVFSAGGRDRRAGTLWDARPQARVALATSPSYVPDPGQLVGKGIGLTPQGDDVLVGYVAGQALFGTASGPCLVPDDRLRTTSLSETLLFHAARGELPEPAHRFLEEGSPEDLLSLGHSSGRALLLGLALADARGASSARTPSRVMRVEGVVSLPPTTIRVYGPRRMERHPE